VYNPNIIIIPRRYRDNISERSSSSSFNQKFRHFDDVDNDFDNNSFNNDDVLSVSSSGLATGIRRASSLRSVGSSGGSVNGVSGAGIANRPKMAVICSSNQQTSPRPSMGSRVQSGSAGAGTGFSNTELPSRASPGTPSSRLVGIFLAYIAAGEADKARALITVSGCPRISTVEATALLARCADNPDVLKEPLDIFLLLVDELGADVNAEDSTGKSILQMLVTDEILGTYLVRRGADVLHGKHYSACALYQSFEYGMDWLFDSFVELQEGQLLQSGSDVKKLRYVMCLCMGGYGSRAKRIYTEYRLHIESSVVSGLLDACQGNWDNLKEPEETISFLDSFITGSV
jgi:hypothetical protein